MTARNYVDNAATKKLSGSVTSGATTITLDSLTGLPAAYPYAATIGMGTASAEQVLVTALVSGATLTVTRNYNGQGAYSHADADTFDHSAIAKDYQEANAHANASSAVHGITGAVVGTTDTQVLTSKSITGDLPISGNTTVGGTLGVTGVATLTGGVSVPGSVDVTVNHNVVANNALLSPGIRLQARYGAQALPASSTTTLGSVTTPAVAEFDTLGFVTTTGVATTPTTGTYEISVVVSVSGNPNSVGVYKNGSLLHNINFTGTDFRFASLEFSLTAADTIDVRVVTGGSPMTVISTATSKSYLRIKRIS